MKTVKFAFLDLLPRLTSEDLKVVSKLFNISGSVCMEELKEVIYNATNYDVANAYFCLTEHSKLEEMHLNCM